MSASRFDVAPPGREEQVKALKGKSGIDNPYAVAWASYEKDGTPYQSAGAKSPPSGSPFQAATERDEPFGHNQEVGDDDMMDDDGDVTHKHPDDIHAASHAMELHQHPESRRDPDDDDDDLLDDDDGEVAAGEHPQHAQAPINDPSVSGLHAGVGNVTDPEPENYALKITSEGSGHGDEDDDDTYLDDDEMNVFGKK